MEQQTFEQKREYYRLKYPKRARPTMRIEDQLFHVCESSEKGLRLLIQNVASLHRGFKMSGTINLHGDRNIAIEGSVLRVEEHEVVVKLEKGISFKEMVEEQRHIRQKFPNFFSSNRTYAA
jgi:hypothetical protein